ncbi:MAG TPA: BatD family protein [Verrucomicrobium sp.]|nr:BatD family protein [Verrucomicrobium sp.]
MNPYWPSISLCLLILLSAGNILPAQEPMARAAMETKDTIYVGQKCTMVVELLAPGFFDSAAAFDLHDPQGLILMPPVSRPVVSSEEINGASYTVQRHELAVLASHAGKAVIPPISVRFQFKRAPLDKQGVPATVRTEPLSFTATLPPGAEKVGNLISARALTMEELWKPDLALTHPKVGDAFTRTITFTAQDLPGMMFPPFPAGELNGIAIYAKPPQVHDKVEGASWQGQRIDEITYVLQTTGRFTLPAVQLVWWDLDAKALQTISLPARTFEVAANPALAVTKPGPVGTGWEPLHLRWVLLGLLLGLPATVILLQPSLRRFIWERLQIFRPVHLQPLNPPDQRHLP